MTTKHWTELYAGKATDAVSWYQPVARTSLELVHASGLPRSAPLLDVGAGASVLADGLLAEGWEDVTILDVAASALEATRARVGPTAALHTIVADVTAWSPDRAYALWHDRAVFHFMIDEPTRALYKDTLRRALAPGARVIVATFAENGPERCSGLPVRRYDEAALAREMAGLLVPITSRRETHVTPAGKPQSFVYVLFAAS